MSYYLITLTLIIALMWSEPLKLSALFEGSLCFSYFSPYFGLLKQFEPFKPKAVASNRFLNRFLVFSVSSGHSGVQDEAPRVPYGTMNLDAETIALSQIQYLVSCSSSSI